MKDALWYLSLSGDLVSHDGRIFLVNQSVGLAFEKMSFLDLKINLSLEPIILSTNIHLDKKCKIMTHITGSQAGILEEHSCCH